jgi:hypothetical protein
LTSAREEIKERLRNYSTGAKIDPVADTHSVV